MVPKGTCNRNHSSRMLCQALPQISMKVPFSHCARAMYKCRSNLPFGNPTWLDQGMLVAADTWRSERPLGDHPNYIHGGWTSETTGLWWPRVSMDRSWWWEMVISRSTFLGIELSIESIWKIHHFEPQPNDGTWWYMMAKRFNQCLQSYLGGCGKLEFAWRDARSRCSYTKDYKGIHNIFAQKSSIKIQVDNLHTPIACFILLYIPLFCVCVPDSCCIHCMHDGSTVHLTDFPSHPYLPSFPISDLMKPNPSAKYITIWWSNRPAAGRLAMLKRCGIL